VKIQGLGRPHEGHTLLKIIPNDALRNSGGDPAMFIDRAFTADEGYTPPRFNSSGFLRNHWILPHALQPSTVAVLLAQSNPKNVIPGVLSNAKPSSN
jgi:hypothetical protein